MRDPNSASDAPGLRRDMGVQNDGDVRPVGDRGDFVAILSAPAHSAHAAGTEKPSTLPSDATGNRDIAVLMASRDFREIVGLSTDTPLPCSIGAAHHLSAAARRALADTMDTAIGQETPLVRPFPLVYGDATERWFARPWATITPMMADNNTATVALRIDTRLTYNAEVKEHVDSAVSTTIPQEETSQEDDGDTWSLEHSLRTLSAAYAAFSWKTDRDGRMGFISDSVTRILGYSPAEMIGRKPTDFMAPDEAERVGDTLRQSPHKLDMPMDLEHRFLTRNGREIWVRVVMIPVHDPLTGHRRGHHGLTIDISDRKETERALGATVARHQALFEAARDAVLILDLETDTVLEANRQAASIIGRPAETLTGNAYLRLFVDQDRQRLSEILATCAAKSTTIDDEIGLKRDNGSHLPAALRATSVIVEGRTLIQLSLRTLEDRISYERQLRQERYAALAANRSKTEFLANMSHELRTPLNAIIGFSEVLEQEMFGSLTGKQKDYVSDILESGRHLLEIINSILDLSKIEVGKFELSEQVVDIEDIIVKSVTLVRERAVTGEIDLDRDIAENLPYLRADPVRLKQVLLNLLSNAVKFTPGQGRVTVAARLDPQTGEMLIEIADTGIGMSTDEIARAMQPFTQVHGDRNRRFEGTGLGLSLAQRLCEQHGGGLEISSTPQVGTRAVIRLPADRLISIGDFPLASSNDINRRPR